LRGMSRASGSTDSGRRIGVCSWSLQAGSPADLVSQVRAVGVGAVQLALTPLCADEKELGRTFGALAENGIEVRSGMLATVGEDYRTLETIRRTGGVRPDEHWEQNLVLAASVARAARKIGVSLVSFHAGFLPEEKSSRERKSMLTRLRQVVDELAEHGVSAALETGQERAEVLLGVLEELDRPGCGVNFDPANMILYGMGDPVAALAMLAPRVRQIHVKDARRTKVAGTWGEEVPVGTGEVDWPAFFGVLRERKIEIDLMIEREAGEHRIADMIRARELVERELARTSERPRRPAAG
jgi:L-ribulose-5-phosphate 3-epimerase